MRFTFVVDGKAQFDRAFNRIGDHVSDLRPVWEETEQAFYKIEREQFASEGAKGGSGKWKPLSAAYAKRKEKDFPGIPILQRTGALQRSLTGNTSDSVLVKTKDEFGIGTNLFYSPYHQQGTSKMPAREPVSFSDTQRTDMTKAMQKGLLKIIRADQAVSRVIDVE